MYRVFLDSSIFFCWVFFSPLCVPDLVAGRGDDHCQQVMMQGCSTLLHGGKASRAPHFANATAQRAASPFVLLRIRD